MAANKELLAINKASSKRIEENRQYLLISIDNKKVANSCAESKYTCIIMINHKALLTNK